MKGYLIKCEYSEFEKRFYYLEPNEGFLAEVRKTREVFLKAKAMLRRHELEGLEGVYFEWDIGVISQNDLEKKNIVVEGDWKKLDAEEYERIRDDIDYIDTTVVSIYKYGQIIIESEGYFGRLSSCDIREIVEKAESGGL